MIIPSTGKGLKQGAGKAVAIRDRHETTSGPVPETCQRKGSLPERPPTMERSKGNAHGFRDPGEPCRNPTLAAGGQDDNQADVDLAAQEPQGRAGHPASTRRATETESEGKFVPPIRWNASGLPGITGLMKFATAMRTPLRQSLSGQFGVKIEKA